MSQRETNLKRAKEKLHTASHLLDVTYLLLKEPKLMIGVIENIYCATNILIDTLIAHELKQNINHYPQKIAAFQTRIAGKYHLSKEYSHLYQHLHTIIELHKRSPVEFKRKDCLVICSKEYLLKPLFIKDINQFLKQAQQFFTEAEAILNRK